MKSLLRFGLVPCLVVVAGLSLAAPALADLPFTVPYEIEAKLQYCADGGTSCVPSHGPPDLANLRFAYVNLIRITQPAGVLANLGGPGGSVAPPEILTGKCAGPHFMDARGNIHTTVMYVFAGPSTVKGAPTGYDGGNPQGTVLLRNGQATSTDAEAAVSATAKDPVSGDTASVTGDMVANNRTNTLVRGGYQVWLSGPQFDEIIAGPDANESAPPTPLHKNGTMTCSTDHTPVSTPGAPPPFFQAQKDSPPNPNS